MTCLSAAVLCGCKSKATEDSSRLAAMARAGDFEGIAQLMDSDDPELRCRAAKLIGWTSNPKARPAQVRLTAYTRCRWQDQVEAAWRLFEADADAARAAITAQLSHERHEARWNMAKLLGKMEHPKSIPDLEPCTRDNNKFVAAWCEWAICRIKKKSACKEPNMDLTNGEPAP